MPKPTRDQRLAAVHIEALSLFGDIQTALYFERKQCLEDRRFYSIAGAQWEGNLGEQFENKPKFEVNKIHLAVIRIINEYRNNRVTARFVPKDGTKNDELADTCNGLFRADEQDSCAEEAYDNAFEEAVGGGIGAWRLRAEYEDDEDPDNDNQRIRIEPIFDADSSVFFDLDAKRQDKADARHCFVLHPMTPDAYEDEYGDDPQTWPQDVSAGQFDWSTPDVVIVAEYYKVEDQKREIVTYQGPTGDEVKLPSDEMDADTVDELKATGYVETRRKRTTAKRVHKYLLSGGMVLEDCGYIAGRNIPIVLNYGKRWIVDGVERCMGHVRLAKDAQRLKNMQLSKLGEISALSSVEKPIFLPEQVAAHTDMWSQDNLKNYPYLLVDPVTDASGNPMPAGPVAYTKPPAVPPALGALLQLTESDMQDLLGNQQQADKIVSNISAEAVSMIQTRLDMQTFIYVSNFAKAVRRCGEIWLSMAKELYVEEGRTMKTVGSQDETSSVTIKRPIKDPNTGALTAENDISAASFDVSVEVGPSSASKREATVKSLVSLIQVAQDPETQQVLLGMAMMNMEGEGMSDMREYFRKRLVAMGAMQPTEEDQAQAAQAAQGQQPSAQDQALLAMAEESQAKATKARADVLAVVADTELTHAKTLETLAGIDPAARAEAIQAVPGIAPAAAALESQ